MSTCAIRAEQVSKKFYLGQDVDYSRLSEVLQNTALGWLKKFRSRTQTEIHLQDLEQKNTFWALRNINFEVQQGEVLGIIGRNGAGKSTLLKILSRVTRPTSGRIGTRGRIGSLLEVGTGFHPELTGRENIFLNGSILGMTRREIEAKFDEIVAFAEIDQFLDTPVKRYSSGMYTRLAFSVAAHLETEILIVDEVLAVGDAAFQKKCLGKMSDVAHQGRTVLFVSHNMAAVKSLCTHGLYLDRGTCVCQGLMAPVLEEYYKQTTENQTPHRQWEPADAPGNSSIRLLMAAVTPVTCDVLSIDSGIRFTFRFLVTQPNTQMSLILRVETLEALVVFQQKTLLCTPEQPAPQEYQTTAELQPNILNQGYYRVTLILVEEDTHNALTIDNAVEFSLANPLSGNLREQQPGLLAPDLQFETQMLSAQP